MKRISTSKHTIEQPTKPQASQPPSRQDENYEYKVITRGGRTAYEIVKTDKSTYDPSKNPNHMDKFCIFCNKAGRPCDHWMRENGRSDGAIICPYLLSIQCPCCGEKGHTRNYCKKSNPVPKHSINTSHQVIHRTRTNSTYYQSSENDQEDEEEEDEEDEEEEDEEEEDEEEDDEEEYDEEEDDEV